MDKFWCRLPFIHTATSPNGTHLVCCEGSGPGTKLSDGIGPYDFINSDFMNNIRDGFLSDSPKENELLINEKRFDVRKMNRLRLEIIPGGKRDLIL